MTDKLRQAAEMALHALGVEDDAYNFDFRSHAYETLRQALAEPEEWDHPPHRNCECKHCKEYWSDVYGVEPVAWGMVNPDGQILDVISPEEHERAEGDYTVPLYTTPQKRKFVLLTDEEIDTITKEWSRWMSYENFARAVEGKLWEKNYE